MSCGSRHAPGGGSSSTRPWHGRRLKSVRRVKSAAENARSFSGSLNEEHRLFIFCTDLEEESQVSPGVLDHAGRPREWEE